MNMRKRNHHEVIEKVSSVRAQKHALRNTWERAADFLTTKFGSISFFAGNAIVFAGWIIVNAGVIPSVPVFDPFPYGLLTMFVSLEAIFLSIIVLISQNRASKVGDIREETDLRMDVITEQEITKLLKITALIAEKQGIDLSKDEELKKMCEDIDVHSITDALEHEIK